MTEQEILPPEKHEQSTAKVEKILNDIYAKLETSKNEATEKLLESIKEHQAVIPELTKANKALFGRINKILSDDTTEISLEVLAFLVKGMSEFSNKHFASTVNIFKENSSPNNPKKNNLPVPGINPLLDEQGDKISKEQIAGARDVNSDLKSHVDGITELMKKIPPTEKEQT